MTTRITNLSKSVLNFLIVLCVTLSMLLTIPSINLQSYANGGIDWGTSVSITQSGQVVDSITVNGVKVDAVYAPRNTVADYDGDQTYCCAAFVKKFYSNVFGVSVWNLYPGNTPECSSGSFTKTSEPRVGDIAANSGHWAIVKSVSNGKVTVIEQNAWDEPKTCAKVGRGLYSGSGYWYWRWSGSNIKSSSETGTKSSAATSKKSKKKSGATIKAKKSYSFSYMIQSPEVSATNATIYTKVNNPYRVHVQEVGCHIYDVNGKAIKTTTEKCSRQESVFNVWYDLNKELGLTLSPKTTYQYDFFIAYDGMCFKSERYSFTTN